MLDVVEHQMSLCDTLTGLCAFHLLGLPYEIESLIHFQKVKGSELTSLCSQNIIQLNVKPNKHVL